jgi:hypothetical protein
MQRGATLGQAGQPGGDSGELVGLWPVQAVGDRDWQPVGRHDHRVGHPWGAFGEVADQPVEVAGFGAELRHGGPDTAASVAHTVEPSGRVVGQLAWTLAADQAAGLRPRWSLGAYCGPRRDNILSSLAPSADWTSEFLILLGDPHVQNAACRWTRYTWAATPADVRAGDPLGTCGPTNP